MGLDMYLMAKRRFIDAEHSKKETREKCKKIREVIPEMYESGNLNTIEVSFEVGHWRKAYLIHDWFVDNVQGGIDDGTEYHVNRSSLHRLLHVCKGAIRNAELEKPLIFFGRYECNKLNIGNMEKTIDIISRALKLSSKWSFYYHATW